MEKQLENPKLIRQRRFMLVLPLITLPFLTLIFWALGGGKVESADAKIETPSGFNSSLPDAKVDESRVMDKMSYYEQAKLDSAKFQELIKNDPNYRDIAGQANNDLPSYSGSGFAQPEGLNTSVYSGKSFNDPNSERIYQKLSLLNGELNRPIRQQGGVDGYNTGSYGGQRSTAVSTSDIDRLEKMMAMMNQPEEGDPEMQQLDGMLEKIMDIQNPERVQQKLEQYSKAKRGRVFAVSGKAKENIFSVLDNPSTPESLGFYSLEESNEPEGEQNAIQAVIHENETLVNGSTVKFRLISDVVINGKVVPKDNFIFGTASLDGERLQIKINSIRYGNSLYPVELLVYDMDGLDGIYIPGAITRDVAKQSADRSMQTLGVASLDPSFGAQAAGAGIEAVKSLVSKKVKLVKVIVKAGYQVLLRDEKQKQDQSN